MRGGAPAATGNKTGAEDLLAQVMSALQATSASLKDAAITQLATANASKAAADTEMRAAVEAMRAALSTHTEQLTVLAQSVSEMMSRGDQQPAAVVSDNSAVLEAVQTLAAQAATIQESVGSLSGAVRALEASNMSRTTAPRVVSWDFKIVRLPTGQADVLKAIPNYGGGSPQ